MLRIVLVLASLCAPGAESPVDETRAAQATIAAFFTALTKNDVNAARAVAVVSAEDEPLLKALAASYAAQSEFHDTFKSLTGFPPGPGLSIRTGITKFMPEGEVLFNADHTAAQCFWGDIPLRKVDGVWRFDFPEYERLQALRERLPVLQADPAFWKDAAGRLAAEKIDAGFQAESRVNDLRRQFEKEHAKALAAVEERRKDRCFADLRGRWKITLSASQETDDPQFNHLTASISIKDRSLVVQSDDKSLAGSFSLVFESFTTRSATRDDDPIHAEWSLRFQRPLNQLRGVLSIPDEKRGPAGASIYSVVGTRAP